MSNQPNLRNSHAFASQILFIFTLNGPTHVLSTILEYFWPENKNFLRNDYFHEQRLGKMLRKIRDFHFWTNL